MNNHDWIMLAQIIVEVAKMVIEIIKFRNR
jgi:hypothetical protein